MKKLKKAKEDRADKLNQFEALTKAAEGRELTDEETATLETLNTELDGLDKTIKSLESIQNRSKAIAAAAAVGAPQDNASEEREMKQYSFARAFGDLYNPETKRSGELSGFEKEMAQEATKEIRETGHTPQGNILIPAKMIKWASDEKKRLLTVATEGSDVVQTEYGGLIGSLRIEPIIDRLGVTKRTGLRGNLKFPRSNNDLVLAWETEVGDADEVTPTFDSVSLDPHRLSGYLDVSIQMMRQSPFALEQFLREKLQYGIEAAYDTALLVGPTGGNNPVGIANYPGVTVVAIGTNGGALTWAHILSTRSEVLIDNVRDGVQGYVINPQTWGKLASTPYQSSGVEGNFILNPNAQTILGERVIVTNRMRSNLSKGSGSNLSELIYSPNWASAILATWGGADILYDPYTQATKGTVRFVVNAFADVDVMHPEEFVVIKDIVTT